MKVYLVIDEWQYEGGFTVYGAYTDPVSALIRQQKERREAEEWRHTPGNENTLEAIRIEEIELES